MKTLFSVELVPKDPLWKLSIASSMAERAGFDGIWVSEHFFNRNSLITLSTIAHHTKKALIGPAVLNPYTLHPFIMAQAAASLWELAPHRVRLAVGAGDELTLKRLGIVRRSPVETVSKTVEELKKVLRNDGVLNTYKAADIKVFIGGQGPKMLEAAVKVADGVLVNWSDIDMLSKAAALLKHRAPKSFCKAAYIITSVHDDVEKARKTAIPYAAYIMAGASSDYLSKIGLDEDFRAAVSETLAERDWEKLYRLSDGEWVRRFSFYGNPSKLGEYVEKIVEMGFEEVVFAGPLGPRYIYALKKISLICRKIGKVVGKS